MKAKTNTVLIIVAFIAYWVGLCNASAFYDPGTQRWLNRDPLGDMGSLIYFTPVLVQDDESDDASELTSDELLGAWTQVNQNLHTFGFNSPLDYYDAFGLQCDDIPAAEPGSANPENIKNVADLEAEADGISQGQIDQAAARRALLNKIQNNKLFGNGLKGSRNIDPNKLKQVLNNNELKQAEQIAKDGMNKAANQVKNATNPQSHQAGMDAFETQMNRANACKAALGN